MAANLFVIVTQINIIDRMTCGYGTLRTTAVRIWHEGRPLLPSCAEHFTAYIDASSRPAQIVSTAFKDCSRPIGALSSFKTSLSYKWHIVACWMHLHNCWCIQMRLWICFQHLWGLCFAPGWPGSNCNYSEVPIRSTGVTGTFICGFWTVLNYANVSVGRWHDLYFNLP